MTKGRLTGAPNSSMSETTGRRDPASPPQGLLRHELSAASDLRVTGNVSRLAAFVILQRA